MNGETVAAMEQCLRHLTTATSTAGLYAPDHPQVTHLCRQAHVEVLRAMGERDAVSLLRVDDQLAVDGQALDRTHYGERLAHLLKRRGIGHLRFLRGVTEAELLALVDGLAGRAQTLKSSPGLRLGQVEVRRRNAASFDLDGETLAEASELLDGVSHEELARVMEVYEAVQRGRQLHVVGLSEIVTSFIDVFAQHADPLLALVPLRNMDEYTFTHSLNVCMLNLAQATALGIEGELLHDIGLAAMLHDIGKLFVPVEVLNKNTPLTGDEWELIRLHPVKGAEYLLDNPGVPRLAVVNAYEHHLHYNLEGYPRVDRSWQQNLCSQMTTIADIYDSMRTYRPYRDPSPVSEVLAALQRMRGSQLNPLLTDNFIRLIGKAHPDLQ